MDRRLFVASALGLLLPGAALAQQGGPPGGGRPGGGQQGGGQQGGGRPGGGRPPGGGNAGGSHPPGGGNSGGSRPPSGGGNNGGRPPGGGSPRPPSSGGHHPSPGPRPPSSRPPPPVGPHRPGAGRPPGFRPVHGPAWRYPRGYSYRRWSVGVVLPPLFLTPTYYYDDYWRMGLEGPPWGYQWVRYGPDLLLVETRTGRIADVIYGAFY